MRNIAKSLLSALLLLCSTVVFADGNTVEVSAGYLKGLKLASDKPSPLVLIIPGSGPTDRDGNTLMGASGVYVHLAQTLFDHYGIATVRVDKRGMFSSSAPGIDPNAVTMLDYADDTRLWIESLKQSSRDGCVWLLGHSEGGLTALLTAQRSEDICGMILAATPGRKMGDMLREQLRNNPANAPLLPQALGAIETLEAGRSVDATKLHPALYPLFYPEVQNFLMDQMRHDPAKLIGAISLPVLVLQGEADLQVSPERDAGKLHEAAPKSELILIPGVTHVLKKAASASLQDNYATYADADMPVAGEVVEAVGRFVISNGVEP